MHCQMKVKVSQLSSMTSEASPSFGDEITKTFLPILFICLFFCFNEGSAFLINLVTVGFYSHVLASQATALILAKCQNRTATMFFEVSITPGS